MRKKFLSNKKEVYINVTPLVDVLLVLLVIFMVSSPMATVGVQVDLPRTKTQSKSENEINPISVSIKSDGEIFFQDSLMVNDDELTERLNNLEDKDQKIYIRGDKGIVYEKIMHIMGLVSSCGFEKIALISETE